MNTANNTRRIIGIKTNRGYYIADAYNAESNYLWGNQNLDKLYFNGEKAKSTFDKMWWWIPDYPNTVEQMESQPAINKRYELKDNELCSEKIPMILSFDEVTYVDDDGDRSWKDTYRNYQSLYEYKEDKQDPKLVPVEFQFEVIVELNIDEIDAPPQMNYSVQKTQWEHDGTTILKNEAIKHQLIDRIITPSILLHNKPCSLSSEQVYKILRQYIKENINPKVAHITSDYDFCFTVKKVLKLPEPVERQQEILTNRGNSYKHKKYKRYFVASREVIVFEMTHLGRNYQGYTPISGINAKDEYELKEKIDELCQKVIEMINEPLIDCPHCKGYGVILDS